MGDTWDKMKAKGAEMKGEMKNEFRHIKEDMTGEDYKDQAAYEKGEDMARTGAAGKAAVNAKENRRERMADQDPALNRRSDGEVNTKAAETKGMVQNEMKHENKEMKKGYNDAIDRKKID